MTSTARILPVVALLGVAACATPFQSRVVRFNQLPVSSAGTVFVQAADPEQSGGLEFQQYAAVVGQSLVQQGYRPAASPAAATYVVTLDYGVDQGRERIATRAGLGYGGFGYGGFGYGGFGYGGFGRFGGYGRYGRFGYGGFYDPFWSPFGYGGFGYPEVYSYTTYNSFVDVEMRRANSGDVVFEGRAEADSSSDDLTRLVPNLVQSLFTGFPGRSGETVRVSIDDKGRATTRPVRPSRS